MRVPCVCSRQALSEVHALSALCDSRTILRYFSSWFEDDVLYVQTEMCWGSVEQLLTKATASVTTASQCLGEMMVGGDHVWCHEEMTPVPPVVEDVVDSFGGSDDFFLRRCDAVPLSGPPAGE